MDVDEVAAFSVKTLPLSLCQTIAFYVLGCSISCLSLVCGACVHEDASGHCARVEMSSMYAASHVSHHSSGVGAPREAPTLRMDHPRRAILLQAAVQYRRRTHSDNSSRSRVAGHRRTELSECKEGNNKGGGALLSVAHPHMAKSSKTIEKTKKTQKKIKNEKTTGAGGTLPSTAHPHR